MFSLRKFLTEEHAATSVEYAVMLMLIAGICIVAIQSMGLSLRSIWGENNEEIRDYLGNL